MECNKDEALRAKAIAEKRLLLKNMLSAKKFALKAQSLFPGLEGMHQLMAVIDVYIAAENKVNGETDWYAVLGVHPQAKDEMIRKQYRKLALLLHPDKNKCTGGDDAFKLVSQAWSLLSDGCRRAAFDQNRNKKSYWRVSTPSGSFPKRPGSRNSPNSPKSSAKVHKSTRATAPTRAPSHGSNPNTFWTECHQCKMLYEYLRVYLNCNLRCPRCRKPFLAVETAPPPSGSRTTIGRSQKKGTNKSMNGKTASSFEWNFANANSGGLDASYSYSPTNSHWAPFSSTGGPSSVTKAASLVQQAYAKVKRQREEALERKNNASKKMDGGFPGGSKFSSKRRRGVNGTRLDDLNTSFANLSGIELGKVNVIHKVSPQNVRLDTQSLLLQKAKVTVHGILSNLSSVRTRFPLEEGTRNEMTVDKAEEPLLDTEVHKSGSAFPSRLRAHAVKSSPESSDSRIESETLRTMSMDVTDSEFCNFDRERTEKCFAENQVWAAYDKDNGMPRYYAFVHSVISSDPFKICISWLTSKSNSDMGSLHWVVSGFSQTCGDFLPSKMKTYGLLSSFSHRVRWTKGQNGTIHIYPRKGEVWALYRNWSPDWNELTMDEVIHKYELVEVLEDYSEEHGVAVIPLLKVAGFRTIFHHHLSPREVRSIRREEMFRFSHQVPSHLLAGRECPDVLEGCRELDPAATPTEFLQVIIHGNADRYLGEQS